MSGHQGFNYGAFNIEAARLRACGHKVINPAENFDGETDHPRSEYMRLDVQNVLDADAVAVLPGWRQSKGSQLEVAVAQECGIPVLDVETLETLVEETILDEASRLTAVDRQAIYGTPLDDFTLTAALWTARFKAKLREGASFEAEDVATAQRLVKESRLARSPRHRDSLVDIAGYARTQEMCWQERERRGTECGATSSTDCGSCSDGAYRAARGLPVARLSCLSRSGDLTSPTAGPMMPPSGGTSNGRGADVTIEETGFVHRLEALDAAVGALNALCSLRESGLSPAEVRRLRRAEALLARREAAGLLVRPGASPQPGPAR